MVAMVQSMASEGRPKNPSGLSQIKTNWSNQFQTSQSISQPQNICSRDWKFKASQVTPLLCGCSVSSAHSSVKCLTPQCPGYKLHSDQNQSQSVKAKFRIQRWNPKMSFFSLHHLFSFLFQLRRDVGSATDPIFSDDICHNCIFSSILRNDEVLCII